MPEAFREYRDSWLDHNPGWDYKLWNLDNLDFVPHCSSLLGECQHFAQMADLLRLEILYRYGGVYVDVDFECLRAINDILADVVAFACSEDGRCVANGIVGAAAGSPLIESMIRQFPDRLGKEPVNVETGPAFFTRVLLTSGFHNDFTLFPSWYFYPFNYHTRDRKGVDLSRSYAVHHYADSWKRPRSPWRRAASAVKRTVVDVGERLRGSSR